MSTSSYLKTPNLGNSQADQLAALTGDILYPELNLSLSNNIKTPALENDFDSSDRSTSDVIDDATSLSAVASDNAASELSQPLGGDAIEDIDGTLSDPTLIGYPNPNVGNEIPIDDASVIIVPVSPELITPTPPSVAPSPAAPVDDNDTNDLVTADVTARIYTIRKVLETLVEGEKAEMLTGSSQFGLIGP